MSNHIIHKQKVIIKTSGIDNAFAYQDTVSKMFANGLTEALEDVLNEIDIPNAVIRIDKLDVDVGEIKSAQFSVEFKQKFLQQVKKSLSEIPIKKNIDATVVKQSASLREAFIYFIQNGLLPWYVDVKNMPAFEALLFEKWNSEDWQFIVNWINKNIANYKQISERIALQFSNWFHIHILTEILNSNGNIKVDDLLHDLEILYTNLLSKNDNSKPGGGKVNNSYLVDLFQQLLSKARFHKPDILIAEQIFFYFKNNNAFKVLSINKLSNHFTALSTKLKTPLVAIIIKNINAFCNNNAKVELIKVEDLLSPNFDVDSSQNQTADNAVINEQQQTNPEIIYTNRDKDNLDDLSEENFNISKSNTLKNTEENLSIKEQKNLIELKKYNSNQNKIGEEKILFVDNCGIVLLHPFLLSYFEELHLVQHKHFVSNEAQQRAILLLYYMATGLTKVAEFNLALQKILCGFSVDETLPSQIILQDNEIEESIKLLQTVIGYWPPLKNTSAEGLQNTFLQRKGNLTVTETGWQLTVEQKTVDILLSKLPWGFSTMKLPWMQAVLNVEWC